MRGSIYDCPMSDKCIIIAAGNPCIKYKLGTQAAGEMVRLTTFSFSIVIQGLNLALIYEYIVRNPGGFLS